MPNYLDLFAGAGGLSEGFLQTGRYMPVAHVEMDKAACYTLKTRLAWHWLKQQNQAEKYSDYLHGRITRSDFYDLIPQEILNTVLECEISDDTIMELFRNIDEKLDGQPLDLIIGGPPCQAYSIAGRSRDENGMQGDKRNYLYKLYARFLEKYQPAYFVFENVAGLLSARETNGTRHFDNMCALFRKCGYSVEHRTLNAKDFGVLQNRRRIIIIGKRGDYKDFYPQIQTVTTACNVGEIFKDLPVLQAGDGTPEPVATLPYNGKYLYEAGIKEEDGEEVSLHYARPNTEQDLEIYKLAVERWETNQERLSYPDLPERLRTHKNMSSFLDRFKVVCSDLPYSQTVVAHVSKDGHYYIHPDKKQNRSLTPREVARLQTFPDSYYFESVSGKPSRTMAYKQIGNAVPVRLARCIAEALLPDLN